MNKKLDSRLFFYKIDEKIVACCSFFRAAPTDKYCAMNGTTLMEYRGNNIFSKLIKSACYHLSGDVYGRTNNPSMAKSLKLAGFEEVASFNIVSIDKLLK